MVIIMLLNNVNVVVVFFSIHAVLMNGSFFPPLHKNIKKVIAVFFFFTHKVGIA